MTSCCSTKCPMRFWIQSRFIMKRSFDFTPFIRYFHSYSLKFESKQVFVRSRKQIFKLQIVGFGFKFLESPVNDLNIVLLTREAVNFACSYGKSKQYCL